MSKRIFISKNLSEVEPYRSQFNVLGYTVEAHSFLSFSRVDFEIEHEYDVIFFGSPRAVIFFKTGFYSLSGDVEIACIGGKTAELLESLGHVVSFRGEKSGEPGAVAEAFKVWLKSRKISTGFSPRVLFPVSDRSLKTVAGVIDKEHKEEVVVYSTDVGSKSLAKFDVYVFTSPSNVEGFFIDNVISEGAKVIAWGKSTDAHLKSRNVIVDYCLRKSDFNELLGKLSSH